MKKPKYFKNTELIYKLKIVREHCYNMGIEFKSFSHLYEWWESFIIDYYENSEDDYNDTELQDGFNLKDTSESMLIAFVTWLLPKLEGYYVD